jgi:hypothetical protein
MQSQSITTKNLAIYAFIGLSVWLNGAVTFRLGGKMLFENGPLVAAASAVGIALAVCLTLRATMGWRKAQAAQSLPIAVVMALPGLFGEAARQLAFHWATGLQPQTQPAFVAAIFFGNAVLLTYAFWRAYGAKAV